MVEVLDANASNAIKIRYTWGLDLSGSVQGAGGIGGLLAAMDSRSGTTKTYWFLYDASGNVGQVLDATNVNSITTAAKYEYDPYGNTLAATGTYASANPFRFSTKWFDTETGLSYYGYRYYSERLGRWMSRDPIGEEGGLNVFSFVSSNPLNRIDPLGRFASTFPLGQKNWHVILTADGYMGSQPMIYESIWSGKSALDLVKTSNSEVDGLNLKSTTPHALTEGWAQLVIGKLKALKTQQCSGDRDTTQFLQTLGEAMHTLEDVYAHTDYVEGSAAMDPHYRRNFDFQYIQHDTHPARGPSAILLDNFWLLRLEENLYYYPWRSTAWYAWWQPDPTCPHERYAADYPLHGRDKYLSGAFYRAQVGAIRMTRELFDWAFRNSQPSCCQRVYGCAACSARLQDNGETND